MNDLLLVSVTVAAWGFLGYVLGRHQSGREERRFSRALATKHDLQEMEKRLMATQAELAVALNDLTTQVVKIGTETAALLGKVADLEAALANAGAITPEVQDALTALKQQVEVVDNLVPDAPVEPPVE